jgi:hypothetical protein
MNPRLIEPLVNEHVRDLRGSASRSRMRRAGQKPRPPVRQRAGWTLVEVGLRLAGPSSRA